MIQDRSYCDASHGCPSPPCTSCTSYLPWYLHDLRNHEDVTPSFEVNLTVNNGDLTDIETPDNYRFNGEPFATNGETNYLHKMMVGTVQEWILDNINQHPIHLHVASSRSNLSPVTVSTNQIAPYRFR